MIMLHLHHTTNPLDYNWRSRHWNGSTSIRRTSHSSEKIGILTTEAFFTTEEIEMLVKMEHITIPMFLILDDIAFLDEQSLMDLGRMLMDRS